MDVSFALKCLFVLILKVLWMEVANVLIYSQVAVVVKCYLLHLGQKLKLSYHGVGKQTG